MSDVGILAASAKVTLLEIAKQSSALALGLQNIAPGEPNNSIQYLFNTSEVLEKIADECDKILSSISQVNPKP